MSYTKVVYDGWMVRYGTRTIGWLFLHMRYFVPESRLLAYYKRKPQDNVVPIKTLVIDGNCRVDDRGFKTQHGHVHFVIRIGLRELHNKNEIEIVADKVRYFNFFMNMILPATHSEDDYSWCVNAVTMKCLRWPAPLEVFLIQSTASDSRTNEENVNIKLDSLSILADDLFRKVRHTNVVQFIGACTKPSNLCIVTGNDDRVFTRYRRQIDHLILLVLLDKNWNFCMDNDFYWNFGMEALEVHSDLEILIISSVSYILCLQKYSDLEVLEVLIMYGSSVCFCIR
ncbi:hypothetical protein Tco_0291481 [Tanacetum coccineum]